jgi:hypothetical protein
MKLISDGIPLDVIYDGRRNVGGHRFFAINKAQINGPKKGSNAIIEYPAGNLTRRRIRKNAYKIKISYTEKVTIIALYISIV